MCLGRDISAQEPWTPWIRPGSRASAFLVVTGDPRRAARLRIRLPSPCRARIRPLQSSSTAPVLHRAAAPSRRHLDRGLNIPNYRAFFVKAKHFPKLVT